MGVVTSDILALTAAGLKTDFDLSLAQPAFTPDWAQIATRIGTTLPTQNYGFLGYGATMEEFKDEVREQSVNQYTYALSDKVYKADMNVDRKSLEDDQYGLLKLRVMGLADETTRFWNELAYGQLDAGFSTLCYDGQYFFDSDHSEGSSGTQVNVTSNPLSDSSLETARTTMRLFKNDKGKPRGVIPNVVVVGPKNERRATDLLGSDVVVIRVGDGTASTGATAATPFNNYQKGKYTLIVNEYVQNFHWFALDTTKRIKPIIIQDRDDVPITTETDMLDGAAMIKERYNFAVRGRFAPGYGPWQYAYGSNASS